MAESKKYFYMRLKENFFDEADIVALESLPDGVLYSNILLKLYLKSLRDDGRLMLRGTIPYSTSMIAALTRHKEEAVEKALKIFKDMNIIEVLDSGAIFMLEVQNYIGKSSTEADRKREFDRRRCDEKEGQTPRRKVGEISEKSPPEIRVKSIYNTPPLPPKGGERERFVPPTAEEVAAYCEERKNGIDPEEFWSFYDSKGWKVGRSPMKSWKSAVVTWEKRRKLEGTGKEEAAYADVV